ncbi:unnamed protein product [Brugia pahangi]|uniref:Uncharacterized protein n=1 Tax=Brugia pahangi TaxID=6280 RepID=A0A0N4T4B2_BRUPA|nr:unnamed protein product [Brugia pahangi]
MAGLSSDISGKEMDNAENTTVSTAPLYFLRSGPSNQPVEIPEHRVLTQISPPCKCIGAQTALSHQRNSMSQWPLTGLASLLAISLR